MKARPPRVVNCATIPKMAEGHVLSDILAVIGSINVVAAELDR
jgi:NADH-quinone oxidoreductase subunit D